MIEPHITYWPQEQHIQELPTAFPPIEREELATSWGKEVFIAEKLARELDLYRAITAYKRALILVSSRNIERIQQIEYGLFLCYYLGHRYQEAIEVFENSATLQEVTDEFPAINELLLALCDSYYRTEQIEKVCRIFPLLQALDTTHDSSMAQIMQVYQSLMIGDLATAKEQVRFYLYGQEVLNFADEFCCKRRSVVTAQCLNAVLPGAGYFYVGQTKAAFTSFVINALFTTAAYQLFHRGLWAPGLITASLEMGWYFGGINGAGLAAKQYNECVYDTLGKEAMIKARLFPILTFETAF